MSESRPDLNVMIDRLSVLIDKLHAKTPQAVTGDRIGLQVLQALGLQTQGVTSFTISFEPNEIVIATVKAVVDKERLEQVCEKYLARLKPYPEFSEPESAPPVATTQTVGDPVQTEESAPAIAPAPQEVPPADAAGPQLTPEQAILKELILEEVAVLIAKQSEQLSLWMARFHVYDRPLT